MLLIAVAIIGVSPTNDNYSKPNTQCQTLVFSPVLAALRKIRAEKNSKGEYLDLAVRYLRNWTDSKCVGIRVLAEDGRIPYESFVGFDRAFWESENFLSVKHDQCVCIRVLTRQWEPSDLEAISPGGSFVRNDLINWAADLPPEALAIFRGKCIEHGFSSIAVVPIVYDNQVIGAIHLADEGKDKYPPEVVEFIESVAPLIGEAIVHYQSRTA